MHRLIIKPGSKITIGGDIPAEIVAVAVFPDDSISYRVAWWDGRQRQEESFYPNQIDDHIDVSFLEVRKL